MNAHEAFLSSKDSHLGKPKDQERHKATFLQFTWAELACPQEEGETAQEAEKRRVAFMIENGEWFRTAFLDALDENGRPKYSDVLALYETEPHAAAQRVHELYMEGRTVH